MDTSCFRTHHAGMAELGLEGVFLHRESQQTKGRKKKKTQSNISVHQLTNQPPSFFGVLWAKQVAM